MAPRAKRRACPSLPGDHQVEMDLEQSTQESESGVQDDGPSDDLLTQVAEQVEASDPSASDCSQRTSEPPTELLRAVTFMSPAEGEGSQEKPVQLTRSNTRVSTNSLRSWQEKAEAHLDQLLTNLRTSRSRRTSFVTRSHGFRTLSMEVPRAVLRAVPFRKAVERCGSHFASTISGGVGVEDFGHRDPYELSAQVDQIDWFISHDWATGRYLKYVGLCSVHNRKPAVWASLLVSLGAGLADLFAPAGILQILHSETLVGATTYPVHTGLWGFFAGPIAFWLTFFFGHCVRLLFRSERQLFVDKICVAQKDESLKNQAIMCIGGILKRSDNLIVLWSPRYLTRLWCVYELATWLYLGNDLASTLYFVPVSFTAGILAMQAALLTLYGFLALCGVFPAIPFMTILPCMFYVLWLLTCQPVRQMVHNLDKLQSQLVSFDVSEAECFCCSNHHVRPDTGAQLPCDRQLVYKVLSGWFKDKDSEESGLSSTATNHLPWFNKYVRETLAPAVARQTSGRWTLYKDSMVICLPVAWYAFGLLPIVQQMPPFVFARVMVEYVSLGFAGIPLSLLSVRWLARRFNRWVGEPGVSRQKDIAVAFAWSVGALLIAVIVWLPGSLTRQLESWIPQAAWLLVLTAFCGLGYRFSSFS